MVSVAIHFFNHFLPRMDIPVEFPVCCFLQMYPLTNKAQLRDSPATECRIGGTFAKHSDRLSGCVCHIYTYTHRHTDTQTHRHTDTQTHRQIDRQTHRHIDTQTHRQIDRQTDRQIDQIRLGQVRFRFRLDQIRLDRSIDTQIHRYIHRKIDRQMDWIGLDRIRLDQIRLDQIR